MAKWLKLYATYTLSTSPNLCHRTTLLNTDVPNCYITLEFEDNFWWLNYHTVNWNMTDLRKQLVPRHIGSTLSKFMLEMCPACTDISMPCRRRRHWLIAASTTSGQAVPTRLSDVFWVPRGYPGVVNLLLQHTPGAVVYRIRSGEFGSHSVGGMNSGVSRSSVM